jgi:hypothetical protein
MRQSSGAIHFELRGADGGARARQGMAHARREIFRLRHPDQPEEPFASFVSDLEVGLNGPGFWVDMADAEAYDGVARRGAGARVGGVGEERG